MDSLTQIVLGAAVGEILLGRKLGNKALLLGAIGGTIPDLDVIYSFFNDDPIRQLEVHRSYSHSMFTHFVLTIPFAWLSIKWNKIKISFSRWYWFWFLAFFTHALLDCCTTYGTQFLLPFTNYQVAFNNISVIDPLYTIPFLIILSICMFFKRESKTRRNIMWLSVFVSSAYMLFTFWLKYDIHQKFRTSLEEQKVMYTELNTTPTILNSILWSAIAINDSVIYTSEYSYLRPELPIVWTPYKRNLSLLKDFDSPALKTITWFSDGNYFVQPVSSDTLLFFNIKWGRTRFDESDPEKAFMFYWKFYRDNGKIKYLEMRDDNWKFSEAFDMLLKRIGLK